eukprot:scaffold78474_cov60-Phaeocystis_antarctica.AAC.2
MAYVDLISARPADQGHGAGTGRNRIVLAAGALRSDRRVDRNRGVEAALPVEVARIVRKHRFRDWQRLHRLGWRHIRCLVHLCVLRVSSADRLRHVSRRAAIANGGASRRGTGKRTPAAVNRDVETHARQRRRGRRRGMRRRQRRCEFRYHLVWADSRCAYLGPNGNAHRGPQGAGEPEQAQHWPGGSAI